MQPPNVPPSPYDVIADFYRRGWKDWYLPSVRPALERLLFSSVEPGAKLLDVCCGCGHVTRELVRRGYRMTGVDSSNGLIEIARKDIPQATFVLADAKNFKLDDSFAGAVSTFDSLNHLLTYEDLRSALKCIHSALEPGAPFFFDMNLEEAYALDLGQWSRHSESDAVGFVRGVYAPETGRAQTELLWFVEDNETGLWRRAEATVEEQCYSAEEIRRALDDAGFRQLETYSAREAGVRDDLGFGRIYVRAWA